MNKKENNEKNKNKIQTKKLFFFIILIAIFLCTIHKLMIIYQLKTQVVAIVRFDFTGLDNLFHSGYEYYAITTNNKAIKISKNDMNKFYNNYTDKLNIYDLDREGAYRFFYHSRKSIPKWRIRIIKG